MFKQIEILIEGTNPEAAGPLTDSELSRVRAVLQPDEHLSSFVRGRVVGAGGALWALTERRLLRLADSRRHSAETVALDRVQAIEYARGRYGHTVAVQADGQRHALFAANPALAQSFAGALGQCVPAGLAVSFSKPLSEDDAADVAAWVSWSRLRLMPSPHQGMAENIVLLREAAVLHERGMLNDAEYGALKGRLLDAA